MDAGRRRFLKVGAVLAPAVILTPGLLMACKGKLWTPPSLFAGRELTAVGRLYDVSFTGAGLLRIKPGDRISIDQGRGREVYTVMEVKDEGSEVLYGGFASSRIRARVMES